MSFCISQTLRLHRDVQGCYITLNIATQLKASQGGRGWRKGVVGVGWGDWGDKQTLWRD